MHYTFFSSDYYLNEKQMSQDPNEDYLIPRQSVPSMFENPEYFEGVTTPNFDKKPEQNRSVKPKVAPKPKRSTDYYNDIGGSPPARETKPLISSHYSNDESAV